MATDDTRRSAEHWQRKYYDSLEELEDKEKEWSEIEKILRLLVSRLTLIAETKDKNLGKQLEKLRQALREEKSSQNLHRLIDEISSNIAQLDKNKSKADKSANTTDNNPGQVLLG